ncbi:MAG: hypothetical protein COV91_02775 [Candidatus Taylorbacteria bacterium CG11_big_fil_rev_8_21_14_0_20_46_11]|uniref:Penicillin-binding protein transpeptidase domain-containing protein n=1 Tax=Candidatus Taylorbacteria bacterium CG11_big_fil_rev_8_21_14_0_20_46_11 TaxID=1975025 RepID=A0A2H0KBT1_9BACT|nr:MAG: hypothetical protein COV91_02775 [Candidatus Taylorbacteria bacterium CG11_big_fil_rev_8_21_14_0_20_46_11]
MIRTLVIWYRKILRGGRRSSEIDPDEIFLDSSNLPAFDQNQFEGRIEKPISRRVIVMLGVVFACILIVLLSKSFILEVTNGETYAKRSEQNRLRHTLIFGERGVVSDIRGELLAWNVQDPGEPAFSKRKYLSIPGLGHVLGYVKYPSKDTAGFYYKVDFEGIDGVEKYWGEYITPQNGLKIVETDALGSILSESVLKPPKGGASITLTVDARLQMKFYEFIESLVNARGFTGGAAVMMDVETGEIPALVSFPEYDSQVLTDGTDRAKIQKIVSDIRKPFLNRVTDGLYTPGSIVKPIVALAALEEGIITPEKEIVSTGALTIPNQYDPERPTVFKDWKAHGAVDMRRAIAVSSDVYFYEIGGGFEDQKGLGIGNIERYMRLFGFGAVPGDNDFYGVAGVIPNPEWKKVNFNGDEWRVGNTYHTAIGQYGFQVTPLQVVRAISAVANGGKLLSPRLVHEPEVPPSYEVIPIKPSSFDVVREGMRDSVKSGTASGLSLPELTLGAKTGTAELGTQKLYVNSWVVGFFPYDKPRYAFAVLMEKGSSKNTVGALYVMREMLQWMQVHTPEYLEVQN